MWRRHLSKSLGLGIVALAIPCFLHAYVVEELVLAMILFSLGFAAVALIVLGLFLLDAFGQILFLKLARVAGAWTSTPRRSLAFPVGEERGPSFQGWAETATVVAVIERLKRRKG